MTYELVVRAAGADPQTFAIASDQQLLIGRADECQICLTDENVSRRHCFVLNRDGRLLVTDLDSANGTYVNTRRVRVGEVQDGDRVGVGETTLECREVAAVGDTLPAVARDGPEATTVLRRVIDTSGAPPGEDNGAGGVGVSQRARQNLATAYRVSKTLARARGLDELLDGALDSVLAAIAADRVVVLLGAPTGDVRIMALRSRDDQSEPGGVRISRTIVTDVLANGASVWTEDAIADDRFQAAGSIIDQQVRSALCVPLTTDDGVIGALYADNRTRPGAFNPPDLELLALIGNLVGLAIARARLGDAVQGLFLDAIKAIASAVDAKDGYTHRHSERVAKIGVRLGRALGRSEDDLETLRLAGLLHDVGKIGVAESILHKTGPLTDAEAVEMRKHPEHGARILSHIRESALEELLPGVRNHHERWDGSGYPDGLAGEKIPWLGRLLAVADALDALTSARPYREPLTVAQAVGRIREAAGKHFDPAVVEALEGLHARRELPAPHDLDRDTVPDEPA